MNHIKIPDLRSIIYRIMKLMKRSIMGERTKLPQGLFLGTDCRILGSPCLKIAWGAEIVLGNNVVLNSKPEGYHAGMGFPVTLVADREGARITIGEGSRLHGCCLHAWYSISVGRKCLLAAGSQVLDAHGHTTELQYARLRTIVQDEPEPVIIEDHCWIGIGALIFKGVHLGEGCIVAANSVVTKGEYPPFSLIAGSPARVIKTISPEQVFPEDYPIDLLAKDRESPMQYQGIDGLSIRSKGEIIDG